MSFARLHQLMGYLMVACLIYTIWSFGFCTGQLFLAHRPAPIDQNPELLDQTKQFIYSVERFWYFTHTTMGDPVVNINANVELRAALEQIRKAVGIPEASEFHVVTSNPQ